MLQWPIVSEVNSKTERLCLKDENSANKVPYCGKSKDRGMSVVGVIGLERFRSGDLGSTIVDVRFLKEIPIVFGGWVHGSV